MSQRIEQRFAKVRAQHRAALVTFVMGGDPDPQTSLEILTALPKAGADMIEIGMPFTDPMADGPQIQAAGLRALHAGTHVKTILELVTQFRKTDIETPLILMGYYNPIYRYGVTRFLQEAQKAGVDGFIVVDLPLEEDAEFCVPVRESGLSFIRLVTPTTDEKRLPLLLAHTSGFVYSVSIAGITGAGLATAAQIKAQVERIRHHTDLPIVVGFGIKTAQEVVEVARAADGVVVGSALVSAIAQSLTQEGHRSLATVPALTTLVENLAQGLG